MNGQTIEAKVIKQMARDVGFDDCGIAKATFLQHEHEHYINWLQKKQHGNISYLEKNIEQKSDPRKIAPEIKSVIGLALSYYPTERQHKDAHYKITKYAYSRDYHKVIKAKLNALVDELKKTNPEETFLPFCDSNLLLEKAWAVQCGLGWRGKHSLLINKSLGSFAFLGFIVTSIVTEYDQKKKDLCGNCTKCMELCPVGALEKPYQLHASSCIAYRTIEKTDSSEIEKGYTKGWIYGCDICQDICPWNQNIPVSTTVDFTPDQELLQMTREDWEKFDKSLFDKLFKQSAVKRIGFERLQQNIRNAY